MEKKISAQKCATDIKLYDCGGSIDGKWFVHYLLDGKRRKVYSLESDKRKGLNSFKTEEQRRKYAVRIIAEIQSLFGSSTSSTGDITDTLREQDSRLKKAEKIAAKSSKNNIEGILSKTIAFIKPNLRLKTLQTHKSKCTIFVKYCKKHNIRVVNEQDAACFLAWLKSIGRNNTTINAYRSVLSSLWETAIAQKITNDSNPFLKLPKLSEQKQGFKPFSKSQKKELKKAISEQNPILWLCCQFLYYCFIRPGELRLLKIGDIDLDGQKILIRGSISKNKKTQYVAIPRPFMKILEYYQIDEKATGLFVIGTEQIGSQTPVNKNWINRTHRSILESLDYETGVHNFAFYSWKHTGCVDAIKAGINPVELQRQLRHHSLQEMMHYLHGLGLEQCDQIRESFPEL